MIIEHYLPVLFTVFTLLNSSLSTAEDVSTRETQTSNRDEGIIELRNTYDEIKQQLKALFAKEITPDSVVQDERSINRIDRTLDGGREVSLGGVGKSPVVPLEHIQSLQEDAKKHSENNLVGADFEKSDRNVRSKGRKYTNEWVIHVSGGSEMAASIIKDLGYEFLGPVRGFTDIYRVRNNFKHHNSKREAPEVTHHISSHKQVVWAEQQFVLSRVQRSPVVKPETKVSLSLKKKPAIQSTNFNDELWSHQWYLYDSRTRKSLPEIDLNVAPVWRSGITGKGIKIIVVDDGLEWSHEDIINNYDPSLSYDVQNNDSDPSPESDGMVENSHGTKCAGEIVMAPNNRKCGVGVAYGAKIGGVRLLDGDITDSLEGQSVSFGNGRGDIMSFSWGPNDDGKTLEGPGTLSRIALEEGVKNGRDGKGLIYVWASGNGGKNKDNCNCDGYASSIYTISINSASQSGEPPWYTEGCSSTLASAYSSGAYVDQKIVTTDINNRCTIDFSGTSAAAPLGAGIIALMLEKNYDLTWRDVQHIIIIGSNSQRLEKHSQGWQRNGIGLAFHERFGFGLLDAQKLVELTGKWKLVSEKKICSTKADIGVNNAIGSQSSQQFAIELQCKENIVSLEHVELVVSLNHTRRGALKISMTSPMGTTAKLLSEREFDDSNAGIEEWPFVSVHTWGEKAGGVWMIDIKDTSVSGESGTIISLNLRIHGMTSTPNHFTPNKE